MLIDQIVFWAVLFASCYMLIIHSIGRVLDKKIRRMIDLFIGLPGRSGNIFVLWIIHCINESVLVVCPRNLKAVLVAAISPVCIC